MPANEPYLRLRQHQRFAARRLLEIAGKLPAEQLHQRFDIGAGSYWDSLVHLYAAELVWLEAIEGNPSPPHPRDIRFGSIDELTRAWDALDRRWGEYLSRCDEAELARRIAKASTSSFAGQLIATPVSDILLHLATHAHYTAAQATNILRRLGHKPLPDTMLITMSRMEASANA